MKYMIKRFDGYRMYDMSLGEVKYWCMRDPDEDEDEEDSPDFLSCKDEEDINDLLYDIEDGNPLYTVYQQFDEGTVLRDENNLWMVIRWEQYPYGEDKYTLRQLDESGNPLDQTRVVPYIKLSAMKRMANKEKLCTM